MSTLTTDDYFSQQASRDPADITAPADRGLAIYRITYPLGNDVSCSAQVLSGNTRLALIKWGSGSEYVPNHPIILLPGQRLVLDKSAYTTGMVSLANGVYFFGSYIPKEQRIPQSLFEQKLSETTEAIKEATIEALREASMKVLVEEVAAQLADGNDSSLSKKLGELIDQKVADAIQQHSNDN